VLGERAIAADTDLRLARYFGMSEGFFSGLQDRLRADAAQAAVRAEAEGDPAAGGVKRYRITS